jgi:hypothetical protein
MAGILHVQDQANIVVLDIVILGSYFGYDFFGQLF